MTGSSQEIYFVVTTASGRPPVWEWQIRRRPSSMGAILREGGFKTEAAAKLAGEKALRAMLDEMARHDD